MIINIKKVSKYHYLNHGQPSHPQNLQSVAKRHYHHPSYVKNRRFRISRISRKIRNEGETRISIPPLLPSPIRSKYRVCGCGEWKKGKRGISLLMRFAGRNTKGISRSSND